MNKDWIDFQHDYKKWISSKLGFRGLKSRAYDKNILHQKAMNMLFYDQSGTPTGIAGWTPFDGVTCDISSAQSTATFTISTINTFSPTTNIWHNPGGNFVGTGISSGLSQQNAAQGFGVPGGGGSAAAGVVPPPCAPQPSPSRSNRFLRANDLLEEFMKEMNELGVARSEMLDLPMELFISWMIVKAATEDDLPVPDGVTTPQQKIATMVKPSICRTCDGIIKPEIVALKIPYCSEGCAVLAFRKPAGIIAPPSPDSIAA